MGHWGACLLKFCKFCVFCSCCQLNCKTFENYQRNTCVGLHFRLCCQKHAKTHVNRLLDQSRKLKEIPGRGGEEKFTLFPLTSFPGIASVNLLLNLRATKGVVPTPLRFFRCHTFCFWKLFLSFQVAIGGPFAHIQWYTFL